MWADVSQQLANILCGEVFESLLGTPSYTAILRKGGLSEPFSQYLKYKRPQFPAAWEGTCRTWAALITQQVRDLRCLADDDTLRAEVIRGPVNLYRCAQSRQKGPEPPDLRRGTAYFGDWWFSQELLDDCLVRCRSISREKARNPALTEMTPVRCLRTLLRRRLAIRIDWNTIDAFRRLVLAANESVPVITGRGLPMQLLSPGADRQKHPAAALPAARQMLPGGDRQIWMPWTPQKVIQLWTPKGGFGPGARL